MHYSTSTFRDLALLRLGHKEFIVAACDAVGGLGSKPDDVEQMEPECVGYFSTRVVLLELLSVRAQPVMAMCTFCVELEPTARQLMDGVKQQLKEEQLDGNVTIEAYSKFSLKKYSPTAAR